MSDERTVLRATFTEDAERYDRARPGYPEALFADLVELTGAGPGSRVLEIGPGTGQATVPLAGLGCAVTAVELGAELAGVARRRLAAQPRVRVVTAEFETWPLPAEPFDVVFSATAFHWIDPAVRLAKAAAALRPGGALATVLTEHVAGGTEPFFAEAQKCYERYDPTVEKGIRLIPAADIPPDDAELAGQDALTGTVFRRYVTDVEYTTEAYLDVLMTYSGHRAMPAPARAGLLACIADLIDGRYGGRITKRYLRELRVTYCSPGTSSPSS
ncbi:class I SAM-dependent methyltransferase [Rhizomonospora bruguierae]|uniref:class I SAM-dependent methyltransferase n=1 Tax=Rhizomonospora bruguierae TaxID=1581705 RepID=UPI001BCD632E|nr:class I SAM-dependent methyltransferase [Micromonospora sp. NBRC 107566]